MAKRNTDNSAGAQAKALGLQLSDVTLMTGAERDLLNRWVLDKPRLLKAVLLGCAILAHQDDSGIIMMPVDIEKLLSPEK